MSVQKIIQESVNKNPLGLKEAFAEELSERVRLALEAKMSEEDFDLDEETIEFIDSMLDEGYYLDDIIDALVEEELVEGSIKGSGTDRKAQLKKAYRAGEADTRDFNRPGGMSSRQPKSGADAGIKKAYQGGRMSSDGSSAAKGAARSKSGDQLAGTEHGKSEPSVNIFGNKGKTHYKTQTHAAKMYGMKRNPKRLPEDFDLSDYTVEELEDFMMSESNEYDKKHVEHGLKLYRQAKKEGALNSEAEGHVAHTAQKKFGFSSEKAKNFANHVSNHDTVLSYASGPRSSLDRENTHGAIKKSLRKT